MQDGDGNLSTWYISESVGRMTTSIVFMCMPFKRTTFPAGVPVNMKESTGEASFPIACVHVSDIELELRMEAEKARQQDRRGAMPKLDMADCLWQWDHHSPSTLPSLASINCRCISWEKFIFFIYNSNWLRDWTHTHMHTHSISSHYREAHSHGIHLWGRDGDASASWWTLLMLCGGLVLCPCGAAAA